MRPASALRAAARLAILVALAAPVLAGADGGRDPVQEPLGVRTPGTLRDLFLEVTQWDARAQPALRLDVGWATANDWSTPTTLVREGRSVEVRLDEQADSLVAALRVPWGVVLGSPEGSFLRRLATALELRATVHWGGWGDGLIETYHQLFAFNDFARPLFPRNEVHLALRPTGAAGPVAIDSPTFAFGDVVLRNQLLLWEGGEPLRPEDRARAGVSARLDVKLPTGSLSRMGGSGGFDVGLGLLGTWQVAPWLTGHAIVTGAYWSPMTSELPLQPNPFQWTAGASLVALWGEWSFLVEDRWASAPFQPGWNFVEVDPAWNVQSTAYTAVTRSQNSISLGARWGPLTFWFQEDFNIGYVQGYGATWFYDTNAPDVAIGLTLTLRP